jgi:hypothetical protein
MHAVAYIAEYNMNGCTHREFDTSVAFLGVDIVDWDHVFVQPDALTQDPALTKDMCVDAARVLIGVVFP